MLRPDRAFGLSPEGFQFVDAASLQIPTQGGFNTGKAVEEALIRAGEALFRFDLAPPGHVHQGEQQIAQFLLGMIAVAAGHSFFEFVQFFMDLFPDISHATLFEAGLCHFLGDGHCSSQGLFMPVDLMGARAASNLVNAAELGIAENVRVTVN